MSRLYGQMHRDTINGEKEKKKGMNERRKNKNCECVEHGDKTAKQKQNVDLERECEYKESVSFLENGSTSMRVL